MYHLKKFNILCEVVQQVVNMCCMHIIGKEFTSKMITRKYLQHATKKYGCVVWTFEAWQLRCCVCWTVTAHYLADLHCGVPVRDKHNPFDTFRPILLGTGSSNSPPNFCFLQPVISTLVITQMPLKISDQRVCDVLRTGPLNCPLNFSFLWPAIWKVFRSTT